MAEFTVKQCTLEGEHDFGDSKMNKFDLVLDGEQGTVQAAAWLRTDRQPPLEGDRVSGDLEQARGREGGLKLKGLRILGAAGGAHPSPSPSGSQSAPSPASSRDRSIERQVAIKAAVEFCQAYIAIGKQVSPEKVTEVAGVLAAFIAEQTAAPAPAPVQSDLPVQADEPTTSATSDDDDIPF